MPASPEDSLATAVFALGLTCGFVRREDIVRWADRRITEMDSQPAWLIDISLSQNHHVLDVIGVLKRVGVGIDADAVFRAFLGLVPNVWGMSFDEAEALAKRIYEISRDCIGDWDNELLRAISFLDDTFDLVRNGYITLSRQEAVNQFATFVDDHRDKRMLDLLRPAVWTAAIAPLAAAGDARTPLVHVGLSSWIIQDGNYDDLEVGQEAKFALELYPPKPMQPVEHGPAAAEHLGASRYRIRARVIFAQANVWVIDAGSFMAFFEQPTPRDISVGVWIEGEIHLGIDPFFYFEYLHRVDGMPPLSYVWLVRQIVRETTPWMTEKDQHGRPYLKRDEAREAFVPTSKTNAWKEDGGNANYVLDCERLRGPERP